MTLLDGVLTAAAGTTAGATTLIGGGTLLASLLSAAVGAGVAYGVLRNATHAQQAELSEIKAWLSKLDDKIHSISDRISRIEGVCVVRHRVERGHE